mgnify:CR=1 FL=1
MTVTEAIRRGFGVAGRSFGVLAILFLFNLIWDLGTLPFVSNVQSPAGLAVPPRLMFLSTVFIFLNIFVQGGVFGTLKDIIVSGGTFTPAGFMKQGGKFYVRFLLMGLLILGVILAAGLAAVLLFGGAVLSKNVVITIITACLGLGLSAIALYYLFLIFLSPYVLVLDDIGVLKAIGGSVRFVRSDLFKMTVLLTLLTLIGLGLGFILGIVSGIIGGVLKGTGLKVLTITLSSAVNSYITVIISAALMIYYHEAVNPEEKKEPTAAPA